MTGIELLQRLGTAGTVELCFRFPYVYVRVVREDFGGLDNGAREQRVCELLQVPSGELRRTAADCLLSLQWCTPAEATAMPGANRGTHWLRAFLESPRLRIRVPEAPANLRIAHFFGYKGGQGRSTVLACLAERLANEGARVLVLDADVEAPSLDTIFGVAPVGLASTLLGVARRPMEIRPVQAARGRDGGTVDIIACRPRDANYDVDFAAFALQASLAPTILEEAAERIRAWAQTKQYHALLVDHRSGMAVPTMAWMTALPGPCVVFAKLDEQWRGAERVIREVLEANPANPGVIVSFKPDEENEDVFRRRTVRQRTDLLRLLTDATRVGAQPSETEEDEEILADPTGLEDHWLVWPYDQEFRTVTLPDLARVNTATREALAELVRLLDLRVPPPKIPGAAGSVAPQPDLSAPAPGRLSPAGSVDQGDLIRTDALARLMQPNSVYRYIFGRKGTGKTRLVRELAQAGLGQALLVDSLWDQPTGIKTSDSEFKAARDGFRETPEGLWWAVLLAGLQGPDTASAGLRQRLEAIVRQRPSPTELRTGVLQALPATGTRTFLLDGIETAFAASEVHGFAEQLFQTMLAVQTDSQLNERLVVRLFLRTDLARRSLQNIEQQTEGRAIYLFWDYQRILCFMLSRIAALSAFSRAFPDVVASIQKTMVQVQAGETPIVDAEQSILGIFPENLRRSNIKMTTFLRIHFADNSAQGQGQGPGPSYYPRVVDKFLQTVAEEVQKRGDSALAEGRIEQSLIIRAHDAAANDYMGQIQQELRFLLDFGRPSLAENSAVLTDWLRAFSGQQTPFLVPATEKVLAERTHLEPGTVRRCLEQMRNLGIFEMSDDDPNRWRVGRLFKSSLKMKYKRRGSDRDEQQLYFF